jgi:Tol biopolymer transport system component
LHLYSLDDSNKGETTIQPVIPKGARTPIIGSVGLASDGRSIYFLAASDGKKTFDYDIYRADLASNTVEKFTSSNGYSTDLSVSGDGKTAVFPRWTSRWGSLPNLGKMYILDLATERITELGVTGTR